MFKFKAIIGHQGPLIVSYPDWEGSKYNVEVKWETGEITFESLSVIAADDPVTSMSYWLWKAVIGSGTSPRKMKSLQGQSSKVRSGKSEIPNLMFGYLIPKNYMKPNRILSQSKNPSGLLLM